MNIEINEFIAWLRTKPENEEYNYHSGSNCPIAQFFKNKGFDHVSVSGQDYCINGEQFEIPHPLWRYLTPSFNSRQTFGSLLNLLSNSPPEKSWHEHLTFGKD